MIKSNNPYQIVEATTEIRRNKDTTMIGALLYKMDDQRRMLNMPVEGLPIYQIKVNALQVVTGVAPPHDYNEMVDTSIIRFYQEKFNNK